MARKRPLPKICIALGFPEPKQLLEAARQEASAGEAFLEFRLDVLERPETGCEVIAGFLQEFPECIVLATCRRDVNHGSMHGSVEDQLRILNAAVDHGAQLFDAEVETAEAAGDAVATLRLRARLIVSYHNFTRTPALAPVLARLERIPADGYKLVTTAAKHSDSGRILELSRAEPKVPSIFLAMGEQGLTSRVLASASGNLFTYAAPSSGAGTAPGQVTAQQLRHLYRADRLTRAAKVYGVIASPVRHSISPAVHNRAFQAKRMDAVYLPFLVGAGQLKDFFQFAAMVPICGFSVTIPHKRAIVKMLDHVDPLSKRIGAVNTVFRKAGKWRGANSDVAGVLTPLARHVRLSNATVLIAGYGGAARSAACAVADAGAKVFITGRDMKQAGALARFCDGAAISPGESCAREFDVLINATPLGMFPDVDQSFFPGKIPASLVFDMVYNPQETLLLKMAREQGKTVIPGIEMFIEQAVKQFELWTDETAPRAVMEKAATEALAHVQ